MKETLEKLWNEYLSDKDAMIDTDVERVLMKRVVELHEKANLLLGADQKEAVETYVDAFCDMEAIYIKKAFIKGCEFAVSFLLEAGNFKK